MRHKDRDAGFVLDMLDAAHGIEACVDGLTPAKFAKDRVRVMAAERGFELLGAAAASVSTELRDAHPQVPWRRLLRVRDALAHDGQVTPEMLHGAATGEIPALIETLETLQPWKKAV